jgi:hypothetical protein
MQATMRPWLSPTLLWKCESIPASASWLPIQAELVSTIWPSSSSVPMATTSQRMGETSKETAWQSAANSAGDPDGTLRSGEAYGAGLGCGPPREIMAQAEHPHLVERLKPAHEIGALLVAGAGIT